MTADPPKPDTAVSMKATQLNTDAGRLAVRLAAWAKAATTTFLTAQDVPGASSRELAALSALGNVAVQLSDETARATWPESIKEWAGKAVDELPNDLAEDLRGATAVHEVLALTYELLVSGPNRRMLGTFFTPEPIVRHMLTLCADADWAPLTVVDPGAGVGAFTITALSQWTAATVLAVDVNVVTLGLLAATAARALIKSRPRLKLVFEDFLTWSERGIESADGPRLILGNPPYTRHQHLSAADKTIARTAAGELVTSGLAGLSTYFVAASLRQLAADDSLCLLLPGNWGQARYGRELREWLWAATRRRVLVQSFPAETEVFPGTQVTAVVLYVGPTKTRTQSLYFHDVVVTNGTVTARTSSRLTRNGVCPATFVRRGAPRAHQDETDYVRLSEIATVRRGVATGANSFFFLDDRTMATLPRQLTRPALVKAAQVPGDVLTRSAHNAIGKNGGPRWLLDIATDYAVDDEKLAAYIAHGVELGLHLRYLTSDRTPWYAVEHVNSPDVFFAPFTNRSHRIIVNEARAVGSNNLYGIYLKPQSPWTAQQLATWLRNQDGQESLAQRGRTYQGRSRKLEPGDLSSVLLPVTPP